MDGATLCPGNSKANTTSFALHGVLCVCWGVISYCGGQGPMKVLDAVQWVRRGGNGLGAGCAAPPPPPPPTHPCCRGVTEGLGALGPVSAPSALPWPRCGLPKRLVGASTAPQPCEAPSPLLSTLPPPPAPGAGAGRAPAPQPKQHALARTSGCLHQSRVPLVVPGAAMPHPPVPHA